MKDYNESLEDFLRTVKPFLKYNPSLEYFENLRVFQLTFVSEAMKEVVCQQWNDRVYLIDGDVGSSGWNAPNMICVVVDRLYFSDYVKYQEEEKYKEWCQHWGFNVPTKEGA